MVVKAARIGQRTGVDLGICHNPVRVTECDRARILQKADLGHFAAVTPFGQSRHRQDVDRGVLLRAAQDELPAYADHPRQAGGRVLLVDKPDATQTYFWIGNTGVSRCG